MSSVSPIESSIPGARINPILTLKLYPQLDGETFNHLPLPPILLMRLNIGL